MKTLILFLMCLGAISALQAQEAFSRDEALKQIYSQYDAENKTAQWVCTKGQEQDKPHEGWLCWKEYATVSVSVELIAEVQEGTTYLVTSAKPANFPDNYECHACAPAIGVGVFAWKGQHWVLKSANPAVGFYGGWGSPPRIELVQVGPEKHGVLLSDSDIGGGFATSGKVLLMPLDRTVAEVWRIEDEQDDFGAYDPTDKFAPQASYRSSAAFIFYAINMDDGGIADYYDIEVISRGNSSKDLIHLKPENWTEIYRFKDGKYRLLRHRDFIEVRKPTHKPVSGPLYRPVRPAPASPQSPAK